MAKKINLLGNMSPQELAAALAQLTDDELSALREQAKAEATAMGDLPDDQLTAEKIAELQKLVAGLKAVETEQAARTDAAAQRRAQVEELRAQIAGPEPETPDGDDGDISEGDEGETTDPPAGPVEVPEQAVEGLAAAIVAAAERILRSEPIVKSRDLNRHLRLGEVAANAARDDAGTPRHEAVLVASSDIPSFNSGQRLVGYDQLGQAMHERARTLQTARGNGSQVQVATLQREFRHTLDLNSTHADMERVLAEVTDVDALVAAGGWCAPSEISYDFFNIVAETGMLDLPSVGTLNRGGFRFPTSPTFAQILAGSPDGLWTWTETQDIAAATGTGQSGVKDCVRVACPSFNEVRLLCDGLCVTAGNLIDFSYPEAVANFLRLIMAARAHLTNQNIIAQLVAGSTAGAGSSSDVGAAAPLLGAAELFATDYRTRFRMAKTAILEAVFPEWVFGVVRSDLAKRNGVDMMSVTDEQIADWFNDRNVRAQFVQDWQVGGAGAAAGIGGTAPTTGWPATVQFLMYAPGTWVRGQGLQLNLGVIRDSVLNATNDHTAAWMEDCYAVAKVGHESLVVTQEICASGQTGAANIGTAQAGCPAV